MAIVIEKGNILHIQWYDPITKKNHSKTTKLPATKSNLRKARSIAKKFQKTLTERNIEQKKVGIENRSIRYAFKHFLNSNKRKQPKTIQDYYRFYKKFTETFSEDLACIELNKLNIEKWLESIKDLPMKQNSIHAYGKQLSHFLNFLFEYNYTLKFKINENVKTKPELIKKIIFNDADIIKIFDGLKYESENLATLVHLSFYTGLRPSEILTITSNNVSLSDRTFLFYSPKNKKTRIVAFHKDLSEVLRSRINHLDKGEKLINYKTSENSGRALKKYFNRINLSNPEYKPYTFRKTFITLCRSRYGMDPSIVNELVGHSHKNTTDRHYNDIDVESMKRELEKFIRPV
jgi:integrase